MERELQSERGRPLNGDGGKENKRRERGWHEDCCLEDEGVSGGGGADNNCN